MNKDFNLNYEQVVTDSDGIMVADFSALNSNGTLHNISLVLNTADLYTANKDKIISEWDEFLSNIVADTALYANSSSESDADSQSTSSSESII